MARLPQDQIASAIDTSLASPASLIHQLRQHRITIVWANAVRRLGHWSKLPPAIRSQIENSAKRQAALALAQEVVANEASTILTTAGVPHVFFKGIHLRRELYSDSHCRPSDDVDLLIRSTDREKAVGLLCAAGFNRGKKPTALPTRAVTLLRHGLGLDLHWELFRPGRARVNLGESIVQTRESSQGLPVPSRLHTSALLTVGTALGDYVTHRIARAVDLDRWISAERLSWPEFVLLVKRLGLGAAAWTTLTWTQQLLRTPMPPSQLTALAPSRLKRQYLEGWLRLDPHRVYQFAPLLAQIGFSLALHDEVSDLPRVIRAKVLPPTRKWR